MSRVRLKGVSYALGLLVFDCGGICGDFGKLDDHDSRGEEWAELTTVLY